jgi:hypothetical protein
MAIINADFGLKRQGLSIFMMSQNLWDFASCKKKTKQNPKLLLSAKQEIRWISAPH